MSRKEAERNVVEAARRWVAAGIAARAMKLAADDTRSTAPASIEGFIAYFRTSELLHMAQASNARSEQDLHQAIQALDIVSAAETDVQP